MTALRTTFATAAFGTPCSDTFWLLIWAIFILDAKRDAEERRKKRERAAAPASAPKPPAGPRPF